VVLSCGIDSRARVRILGSGFDSRKTSGNIFQSSLHAISKNAAYVQKQVELCEILFYSNSLQNDVADFFLKAS
jgi:hypothetical protein